VAICIIDAELIMLGDQPPLHRLPMCPQPSETFAVDWNAIPFDCRHCAHVTAAQ